VEITAEGESIIIRPAKKPREGWDAAFQEMATNGDDLPLDDLGAPMSHWDETDWEW
jgi:antitoxin MazE